MASVPPVSYSVNKLHTNLIRQQQRARSQPSLNETNDGSKSPSPMAGRHADYEHSLSITPQTTPPSSPLNARQKILVTIKGFYNSFSSTPVAGSSLLGFVPLRLCTQPSWRVFEKFTESFSDYTESCQILYQNGDPKSLEQQRTMVRSLSCPAPEDVTLQTPPLVPTVNGKGKSGANDGSPGPRKG